MKTNLNEDEKYFAAILGSEGGIELIEWFATKQEAKAAAKDWRSKETDSFRRKDIFYGKVLV